MITRCFIVPQPSGTGVWSAVTLPPLPQSAPKVIQSYCLSSWFVWSHNITFENRIAQLWMPEAIIVLIYSDLHRTQSRKYHLPLFHFLLCGMTTSPAVGVLYSFQDSWHWNFNEENVISWLLQMLKYILMEMNIVTLHLQTKAANLSFIKQNWCLFCDRPECWLIRR